MPTDLRYWLAVSTLLLPWPAADPAVLWTSTLLLISVSTFVDWLRKTGRILFTVKYTAARTSIRSPYGGGTTLPGDHHTGLKLEGFSLEVLLSQFHRLRLRWSVLCFLGLRPDSPLSLEAALH